MSSTNPRVRKIADRIQVIVAEMLERRIKDPRLGFVTVTDVRVTGDTQQATVFYTVLGEEGDLGEHRRGAGVGQGPAPLRGRQAARHAARADAGVRPRRAARERPPPRRGAGPGQGAGRGGRGRGAVRRTPARPTPTRSPARPTTSDDPERRAGRATSDRASGAGRRRQARRPDLARRRRAGPPAGRHPQGRARRHARPDGHRRAGARRQPGHPAARPPDADREGVRRHRPARCHHDHRRRRGRGRRDRPTPAALDEAAVARRVRGARRRDRAGARRRCRRSRSTASAPTQRVREGEDVELAGPPGDRPRARRSGTVRGAEVDLVACAAPAAPTSARSPATLGAALGVGGHLTALRRTAVGPFGLDRARTLERARGRLRAGPDRRGGPRRPSRRRPRRGSRRPTSASAARSRSTCPPTGRSRCSRRTASSSRSTSRRGELGPRGRRLHRLTGEPPDRRVGFAPVQVWRSLDDVPADLGRAVVDRRQLRRRPPRPPVGHRRGPARSPTERGTQRRGGHLRPAPDGGAASRARALRRSPRIDDAGRAARPSAGVDARAARCRSPARSPPGRREEFVDRVLVGALHAAAVVVGANFRFGSRAAGDVALLREVGEARGFVAEGIAARRRAAGVVLDVRPHLPRPPATSPAPPRRSAARSPSAARVVEGDRRGRELGYPTANVPPPAGTAAPADGVYAGWLHAARHRRAGARPRSASAPTRPSPASASAGSRPTCWTATTSSSTASRSRSPSSSGCAAWSRFDGVEALLEHDGRRRTPDPRRCWAP